MEILKQRPKVHLNPSISLNKPGPTFEPLWLSPKAHFRHQPFVSGIPPDCHPTACLSGPTSQCSWLLWCLHLGSGLEFCSLTSLGNYWHVVLDFLSQCPGWSAPSHCIPASNRRCNRWPSPALPYSVVASHLAPAWHKKSNGNRIPNGARMSFKWLLNLLPTLRFYDYFPFRPLSSLPKFHVTCWLIYIKYCFSSYPEEIKPAFGVMVSLIQLPNQAPCLPKPWGLLLPFTLSEDTHFCMEGTPSPCFPQGWLFALI